MNQWLQRLFSGPAQAMRRASRLSRPRRRAAGDAIGGGAIAGVAPAPSPAPTVSFDQLDQVNGLYHGWLFDTEGDPELDYQSARRPGARRAVGDRQFAAVRLRAGAPHAGHDPAAAAKPAQR